MPRILVRGIFLVIGTLPLVTACNGKSAAPADLSAEETMGFYLAIESGCASCHGKFGEKGHAPAWVGLADSEVPLEDGSTVIADDDYLFESIRDPGAKKVKGAHEEMPTNNLTDEQIRSIILYIRTLKD